MKLTQVRWNATVTPKTPASSTKGITLAGREIAGLIVFISSPSRALRAGGRSSGPSR